MPVQIGVGSKTLLHSLGVCSFMPVESFLFAQVFYSPWRVDRHSRSANTMWLQLTFVARFSSERATRIARTRTRPYFKIPVLSTA